jgi:uncharacterized protein YebE (UPF0316 family)
VSDAFAAGAWLLPLSIFVAEMTVVTASTLRIIFIARGHRYLAPILGFFEVLIWLFAIGQVMQNLSDWPCFLAFACGFTLGNWFGLWIEGRLALGTVVVRVITPSDNMLLVEHLRAANFGVTCVEAKGAKGPVEIIMTVIKRKQLPLVKAIIETHQPHAFFSVEELQTAAEGVFPAPERRAPSFLPSALRWLRLGKKELAVVVPLAPTHASHEQTQKTR